MFFVKKVITAMFFAVISFSVVSATDGKKEGISIGIAADKGAAHFAIESVKLHGLNHATVYSHLRKEGLEYSKFPKGLGILLVVKMPKGSNLKKIATGQYDKDFRAFAQKVNVDGRPITLRILPEFNGNWYSWGVYRKGNAHADFIPAWRHIITVLRKETDLLSFDLNYNRKSLKGGTSDFKELYPGDEWVNAVSVSTYNRCGISKHHRTPRSFAEEFKPAYDMLESFIGKDIPINIAETATTSLCGTKKKSWYKALFESLERDFPRTQGATFFFVTKEVGTASNDKVVHWELESREEVRDFGNLLEDFRKRNHLLNPNPLVGAPVTSGVPLPIRKGHYKKVPGKKTSRKEVPLRKGALEVEYPWRLFGRLERVMDEGNPAISPVTGKPFGGAGTRFRFSIDQAIMWKDPNNGVSFGPKAVLKGVSSDNKNRWWDNAITAELGFQICKDQKSDVIDWGRICAFGKVEHQFYLVPDILSDGATRYSIGVELNIGGKW